MTPLRLTALGLAVLLTGCQDANKLALRIGAAPPGADKLRAIETQQFPNTTAPVLLAAATATLQDLGYIVTDSAPVAGVIAALKNRDAVETGQVAGQIALTVVFAALGTYYSPTWDKTQTIHVTFVVAPTQDPRTETARVSFDRNITNNHDQLWRTEIIQDPKIYQQFFDRLHKGISLEGRT